MPTKAYTQSWIRQLLLSHVVKMLKHTIDTPARRAIASYVLACAPGAAEDVRRLANNAVCVAQTNNGAEDAIHLAQSARVARTRTEAGDSIVSPMTIASCCTNNQENGSEEAIYLATPSFAGKPTSCAWRHWFTLSLDVALVRRVWVPMRGSTSPWVRPCRMWFFLRIESDVWLFLLASVPFVQQNAGDVRRGGWNTSPFPLNHTGTMIEEPTTYLRSSKKKKEEGDSRPSALRTNSGLTCRKRRAKKPLLPRPSWSNQLSPLLPRTAELPIAAVHSRSPTPIDTTTLRGHMPSLSSAAHAHTHTYSPAHHRAYTATRRNAISRFHLATPVLIYAPTVYEAFHVNCPSARRANPKSCYF